MEPEMERSSRPRRSYAPRKDNVENTSSWSQHDVVHGDRVRVMARIKGDFVNGTHFVSNSQYTEKLKRHARKRDRFNRNRFEVAQ